MQSGDVRQQEAQDGARADTQGSVRGAALVPLDRDGFEERASVVC
jgi:hypothetical protein